MVSTRGVIALLSRFSAAPNTSQPRTIESPWTETAFASSGRDAGPFATEPSKLNLLPWHGQLIVPSCTSDTVQPACVQMADNPLNTPAEGWVSTMSSMITPDPTGTSEILAIAFAAAGGVGPPVAGGAPAVVDAAPGSPVAAGFLP